MFKKTIISEFFTTISFSQALSSLYLMTFGISKLKNGEQNSKLIDLLENKVLNKNEDYEAFTFYNGRSAIYHSLKMIGLKDKDEIVVSSYTCSVVVNSVLQSGGKILYCDIEKQTLGLDIKDLKKKINKNTKVIIVQHTFGKKSRDYEKIIKLARENNILIIEDHAHSLGNHLQNNPPLTPPLTGGRIEQNRGDFIVYSTGRDKVISSVTGGILIVNNKDYFGKKIKQNHPKIKTIFQNLMYNIVGYKAYKLYDFLKLGRFTIYISRKLSLITEILCKKEKNLDFHDFDLSLPNSLAYLAYKDLQNLEKYTKIRLKNTKYYLDNIKNKDIEIIFKDLENYNGFRFPILLKDEKSKQKLIKIGRKNNIIFGTSWSGTNIVPKGINYKKTGYKKGSCKTSEDISSRILTLPNHNFINQNDFKRVIGVLNKFK